MSDDGRSGLIHVEGGRSLTVPQTGRDYGSTSCSNLVSPADVPIVPVRFTGGLPVEPAPAKLDFPAGFGKQVVIDRQADFNRRTATTPLMERKALVLNAINETGIPNRIETPHAPDEASTLASRPHGNRGNRKRRGHSPRVCENQFPSRLEKLFQ